MGCPFRKCCFRGITGGSPLGDENKHWNEHAVAVGNLTVFSNEPIEERDGAELRAIAGVPTTPPSVVVWNPAFDVTPASLISGIVTEAGVARAPYEPSLRTLLRG